MIGQISNPIVKPIVLGPIFTPALPDISNLEINLDASESGSILTPTGNVSAWLDIEKGNNATQVLLASQPTFGTINNVPGVNFGSVDSVMNLPFTYDWTNLPFTIIAVATKRNSTGFRGIISNRFGAGAGNWWIVGQNISQLMVLERTRPTLPVMDFSFDARSQPPQIYEFNHNSNDTIYLNGVLTDTQASGAIGGLTNDLKIGRWLTASQAWDGFHHQILVYSKSINVDERSDLMAALRPKWQGL